MKIKTLGLVALLAMGCLTLTGCNDTENPEENVGMANPASVYCEEQGGTLQIETAEDGSQSGICIFEDGSYCEEWAFKNEECQPGEIIYNTIEDEENSDEVNSEEEAGEEIENPEISDEENAADNGIVTEEDVELEAE